MLVSLATAPTTSSTGTFLRATFPRGCILGTVDIVDVVTDADSEWAEPGQVHWILRNPRPLETPVPATGRLGLWAPDTELLKKLQESGLRTEG
jgi:hypothetical protein